MFGNVETCVCCGKEIPEGRQVCATCEHETNKCSNCKYFEETTFYSPAMPCGERRLHWCRAKNEVIKK